MENKLRILLALLTALVTLPAIAGIAPTLVLDNGAEIPVERFVPGGTPKARILWLPSEYGVRPRQAQVAQGLAQRGFEVWAADLHTAYFLAPGRSSLDGVPLEDVAALIARAGSDGRPLLLLAASRGASLALEAARQWQLGGAADLLGAVLLYPNLYEGTPQPGSSPAYRPIAGATNLPIFVLQPELSGKRWHINDLSAALAEGGSEVFVRLLPDVGDDWLTRFEVTELEASFTPRVADMVEDALRLLRSYAGPRQPAAALDARTAPAAPASTAGDELRRFDGEPVPPPLRLPDLAGRNHDLDAYRGQVVLVNFWATWCPPCVREIPSLGRLQHRFADRGFTVLGVDVGDAPEKVEAFLAQHPAGFPVLLDADGDTVGPWHIHAFPTNFLLDAEGRIRFAYLGALEWDAPAVVSTVAGLLDEAEAGR